MSHDPGKPPAPETDAPEEESTRSGGVADFVKRTVVGGIGSLLFTEEGVRRTVADLKLPKEMLGALMGQAEKTRDEVTGALRKEIRKFLNSDAFKAQLLDLLKGVTLEVKAEVRLKPSPEVLDLKMRVKGTEDGDGKTDGDAS